jgi:hypothetical protein
MTRRFLSAVIVGALLLTGLRAQTPARSAPRPGAPHLFVIIVIDQFRADYVDWYGSQWTKGLRRLLDGGAVFTNNAYPYAATLTCAGHATISTGAFPAVHGMSGNTFYDRALRRTLPCVYDPDAAPVAFGGGTGREHHGPRSLLAPTFSDELRRQAATPPQVVAVGEKPRTAVTLAGKGGPGTIAVWEEDDGTWATSDAYSKTPWPEVDQFVRAHPMKAAYGETWTLLRPPASYRFTDDAAGEARPRTFPHPLTSTKGVPDNEFTTAWERSPLNDEFLTGLAIELLKAKRLGTGEGIDLLALSLPSLDHTGHDFGPRSFEVQDVLARLDVNLGRLLDAIEAQVGGNYALGLSSDHGVALLPEHVTAEGGDAGRLSSTTIRAAVNTAVQRVLGGTDPYVAAIYEQQVALNPGVLDRLRAKAGGLQAVKTALTSVAGIAAAYSADDMLGESKDAGVNAWRLSYVPGRSGDFMFTPKPNWMVIGASGSTHGTLNAYDQRVPLILFGAAIRPGRYADKTSPADLTPTFASLAGITMARAQGRALTNAVIKK